MNEALITWLAEQGIPSSYLTVSSQLVGLCFIFVLLFLSYYIAKHLFLGAVHAFVTNSKNKWDDLFLQHNVFVHLALLLPFILLLFLTPLILAPEKALTNIAIVVAKVAISFQVARCISAALNVINSLYRDKAHQRYLPLNSTIQVIKLAVYLVATILAISFILGRSPIYLLSGLGALTAVLLLIFQDTIKGLVASIQISANRMVAPGDWIEIPKYGADGDVLEIGLNTVKVQNFDRTVTTVPTYALISDSFKNWRDMFNSGGRRIKRSIIIDISSIKFLSLAQINALQEFALITDYLTTKVAEISDGESELEQVFLDQKNRRQLTNVGTFRAYIEAYLTQHDKVHKEMTCMVRQLPATENGLPLELYFFSNDQNWVNYEGIQADIFDHLFAMAPLFELRIFQHPTGFDWHKNSE
ncbi:mechanosensitive ion channel family protein [Thalassotalea sp. PLHSN55]|uniref:mechanosensitive ion channel family protein n=1 Tax=Thalassotalea sp. PLHSN55 TaxID=3435888 RepID=UPI003F83A16E